MPSPASARGHWGDERSHRAASLGCCLCAPAIRARRVSAACSSAPSKAEAMSAAARRAFAATLAHSIERDNVVRRSACRLPKRQAPRGEPQLPPLRAASSVPSPALLGTGETQSSAPNFRPSIPLGVPALLAALRHRMLKKGQAPPSHVEPPPPPLHTPSSVPVLLAAARRRMLTRRRAACPRAPGCRQKQRRVVMTGTVECISTR